MQGAWNGSCHCGAVRFTISADIHETTSCDCSLCSRKNAVMCQVKHEQLTLTAGEEMLGLYQWNTGIARHHFCTRCGIYTFHSKRAVPDSYGVNVFCLEGFDRDAVPHRRTHGATMTVESAEPRPEWTGPREA